MSDRTTVRNELSYNFFLSVHKSDVKWMRVLSCTGDKSNLFRSLLQTTIENGRVEARVLCHRLVGIYGNVLPAVPIRNPSLIVTRSYQLKLLVFAYSRLKSV